VGVSCSYQELMDDIKKKMVGVYPGFTNIRTILPNGKVRKYSLSYMITGLVAAGESDLPVRLWSFYRDVESFFEMLIGKGAHVIVD
jgi:hypothetical protein